MVQKVLHPSLPLPSPPPAPARARARSVCLSEGVEVLMRTRNNKTKRPSVTRPDRAHYNNSFNRTPASLFIVHTLCTRRTRSQMQRLIFLLQIVLPGCIATVHLHVPVFLTCACPQQRFLSDGLNVTW